MTKTKTPEELAAMAEALTASYMATIDILNPQRKTKPNSNYASKIGHPCAFFGWAKRAKWEDMPTPDMVLRQIFGLGREHEHAMRVRLELGGWKVTKAETAFVNEELNIHGYMDWELSHPTEPGWQQPVKCEFKTTSSNIFPSLHSFEALFEHRNPYIRLAPYQVLEYAAMDPELSPQIAVVYRNKGTGVIKPLLANTADHVHRLEECHERIRLVNAALRGEADPPEAMTYVREWCERCDAAAVCPTMQQWSGGLVAKVIPDPAVVDAIADAHSGCSEKAKLADAAWQDLKDQLEHYGGWKNLCPGERRQIVGARWRYECALTRNKQRRLKPVLMADDAAPDEEA